jgi:plasmid stabilization system protein ParE
MTYRAVIRPRALEHWADALARYLDVAPNVGDNFNNSVQDALDRICMQPLAYPVAIRDVRSIRLEHFPYRLYYRVVDQSVVVHVIFHLSRDPEKLRRYLGRI